MTTNLIIYVKRNIYGNYFVDSTYFYDKVKGDRSNKKYTIHERQIKKLEKSPAIPYTRLKSIILKKSKTHDFKTVIRKID